MCSGPEERSPMQTQAPSRRELGLPCPTLGGAPEDLPSQRRGEGAPWSGFAASPVPTVQHPELYTAFAWESGHRPRRAGREPSAGCCPESWQLSPDKPLRLCQGNRYPDRLPGATRLLFPGETHKAMCWAGTGAPGLLAGRQLSGPREDAGARLGVWGSVDLRGGGSGGFPKHGEW